MAAPGSSPAGGEYASPQERRQRDHRLLVSQFGRPLVTRYIGAALEERINRLNARQDAYDEEYQDAIARGETEAQADASARNAENAADVDANNVPYPGPPPAPLTPAEVERERLYDTIFFSRVGPPFTPSEVYRRRANAIDAGMTDAQLMPWPTLESVHANAAAIGLMPIAEGGRRRSRARRSKTARSTRIRRRR
jgi:hypothetical protein